MEQGKRIVFTGAAFITGFYFLIVGLIKAKPFLAPVATAVLLALLMLPASRKMEGWGLKRIYTSLLNTFLLFLVGIGFMLLISFQIDSFIDDWDKAEKKIMPQVEHLLYDKTPLEKKDVEKQSSKVMENAGSQAMDFANGIYNFTGDYLLTFIYLFFFLNYRRKFKKFFIKLFPQQRAGEVKDILTQNAKIAQGYLWGKFLLMILLAVLYAVGMGVSGVKNFIIISILASVLSIIPYIGNIIGFVLAIGLGYLSSGENSALIGIVVTFGVVQFIESYVLEPYVVGDKVDLDPFMTIIVVVVGSFMWGVIGMVLSIPILGMLNIVFKHVDVLKPYSYLLSNTEEKENGQN